MADAIADIRHPKATLGLFAVQQEYAPREHAPYHNHLRMQ